MEYKMIKIIYKAILLSLCLLKSSVLYAEANSQQIVQYDFSALPAAISIADQLKKGITPSENDWQNLFSQPAYQLVFNISSLSPKKLKARFTHAFSKDQAVYQQNLDEFEQIEIAHLQNALSDLTWLNEFKQLVKKRQVVENAFAMAQSLIPNGVGDINEVQLIYGVFGQNAHASKLGVVLDPYLAYLEFQHAPYELEAHELHHYLRNQIVFYKPLNRDDVFDRAIEHLIHEGTANLLDKESLLSEHSSFAPALKNYFQDSLSEADKNLAKLDSLLLSSIKKQQYDNFFDIQPQVMPLWGHATGWYMTKTIVKAGLKKELIAIQVTPRKLPALYNRAVKKLGGEQAVFSQSVLEAFAIRAKP